MAIKGKRKSQSRGSQARRRPAAAPRPPVAPRKTPWYQTERARVVGIAVLLVVVSVTWWAVARAQENARGLESRQGALEAYTGEVQALLQVIRSPVQGMSAVSGAGGADMEALGRDVQTWIGGLGRATVDVSEIESPSSVSGINDLYEQAVGMYLSAAKTFNLATEAEGELRVNALARAAEQRDAATGVWAAAIQLLDRERARADLERSGLSLPAPPAGAGGLGVPDAGGGGG
jgi:hypothetical protein